MKFNFTTRALVVLCGIAGVLGSDQPLLRGNRELQGPNGAEVICAYIVKPDGTRVPVISPCVDPPAMAATVGDGTSGSNSDSRD